MVVGLGLIAVGPHGEKRRCSITSFVIGADDEVILFDTGMNPAVGLTQSRTGPTSPVAL